MSTRKIRLSQKLTLSFRDSPMPVTEAAVEDVLDQEPDHQAFDSLPDLLPEVFQSRTGSRTLDIAYSIGDYSTYQFWEATAEVVSLASQHGGAESRSFTETLASGGGTDNSVHSDVTHSDFLHSLEIDHFTTTKFAVRENLRRVQAYSPQESMMEFERELQLDSFPMTAKFAVRENLRSVQADSPHESMMELEREPDHFEFDSLGSDTCVDGYLLLHEHVTQKSSSKDLIAAETGESSRVSDLTELHDFPQVSTDMHNGPVKKLIRKRKSTYQMDIPYDTNPPLGIKKQKRSTVRRQGAGKASGHLECKMKWLSDTGHSNVELIQATQVVTPTVDKENTGGTVMKKPRKRKTVSVSTVEMVPGNSLTEQQPAELDPNVVIQEEKTQHTRVGSRRSSWR